MAQHKDVEGSLVHLTPAEMRRLPKPRVGFEAYAAQLIAMAEADPSLRPGALDLAALKEELREYQALQAVVASARQQLALALQTRLLRGSNVWRGALRIYRRAGIEAKSDVTVEYRIRDFGAFMKPRRPAKRKR